MALFRPQRRVQAFCLPPGGSGRLGALRGLQACTGGAGSAFPRGLSPVGGVSPVPPGYLPGRLPGISLFCSQTPPTSWPRSSTPCCAMARSAWMPARNTTIVPHAGRWLARPVVNSGQAHGPALSLCVCCGCFRPCCRISVFSRRRRPPPVFVFTPAPVAARGCPGRVFLPGPGAPFPGFPGRPSGAAGSPSSGPSGGNPGGSSGPPARRSHAPLPAPAAGGGFAGFSGGAAVFRGLSAISPACPPFPPACPPFSPARSPRFPAYLLFCPQSRLQAFYLIHGVLHAPEAAGLPSASLVARRGRFPVAPDRPSPAARPGFFAPYI